MFLVMLMYFQACYRRLTWRPSALLVTTLTAAMATLPAHAETVTDRFVCSVGPVSRLIEHTFINEVNSLPCEIRETREDGIARTLWRASFDVSFCARQMDVHRERLRALGWTCQSIDADGNAITGTRAAFTTTDALTPTVDAPSGVGLGIGLGTATPTELRERQGSAVLAPDNELEDTRFRNADNNDRSVNQVIFFEDSYGADDNTSDAPAAPQFGPGQPTEEQLRQIDDWLIYLSAQSMASIRLIMPDAKSFSDYQITEDLNSADIYTRLQNRIEFLQRLLEQR